MLESFIDHVRMSDAFLTDNVDATLAIYVVLLQLRCSVNCTTS